MKKDKTYKYYEIVLASNPDDGFVAPNCDVWFIKCKRNPTIEEIEKFFEDEMKNAECDHVDSIEEVDLDCVFSACVNLKREEDIIVYEME